jgi:ABC-2 type transport system ATP-binding protein
MVDSAAGGGAAVEVHQLSKRFGDFVAVDGVSFTVAAGEIFGFLGPNGAGKTTTIKMLNGLLAPSSGSGRVAGFDIATERTAIKSSIGYMSQLFSLYGDLTVDENIGFFAGLYGVGGARLAERRAWVVEMAGLADQRDRLTGELALGWKQRLALGCAVLHEPPILFLDEPTSGVDPISRRRFWDLIYELADGGTTVFVTTHYMEEAESCHRLALMNRGRLIALDTPAGLRAAAREHLLELETRDPADAIGALAALDGAPGVLRAGLFGRSLHVTVADREEALASLPRLLASRGIAVSGLREIPPSLEDVFISLVQAAGGAKED